MDDRTIRVLDHGFVSLIDSLGDDKRVTDAARISYAKDKPEFDEKDVALLRYLMRHSHWTPFEMVHFTFRMKLPIFVARQLIRHRTANVNEMSGRYTQLPSEIYIPEITRMNPQSKSNNQGSEDAIVQNAEALNQIIDEQCMDCYDCYEYLLSGNLSKELSRMVLPLNIYTEWYWTMDLRNLLNFLRLRLDSHAQYEIQVYADAVYQLIKPIVPHTCEAFDNYVLNAITFSKSECKGLTTMLHAVTHGLLDAGTIQKELNLSNFEWAEFIKKLEKLDFDISSTGT